MRTRNRFLAVFATAMVAGLTVYRVGYTEFNGYGTFTGSTCLRCRASQIEITACGWQYNQHVKETECSRWYNSHRPTHTHHWIRSTAFSRTHYPAFFLYFMGSRSSCGHYVSSLIVFISPEVQLDFLKSATPEDEEYFFTIMAENGDRKIQHKLYEYTNTALEREWERSRKNAATPERRLQDIVSATP